MTEIQKYDVVKRVADIELRRNAPCTVADVRLVGSSFNSAGSLGFRPLVTYIGGANEASQSIAMTAPVLQEGAESDRASGGHIVSFVLPAGQSSFPAPRDSRVMLREIPEEYVAVLRYSGRSDEATYHRKREQLREAMVQHGWVACGPARLARYDPPWTPWFMRRNEVQIPIDESSTAK